MENKVVNSITKYRQSKDTLHAMTEIALHKPVQNFTAYELAGGMCNAVYLIEADQEKLVLKIAPDESITMMRHEKDILLTEAHMLANFQEKLNIPSPRLIHLDTSCTLCNVPYFFMSYLEGTPLLTIHPRPAEHELTEIKREVGVITRKISSLPADYFGIPAMPDTFTDNNCDFILLLFDMLFQDAFDYDILIPTITREHLLQLIESLRVVLNEVNQPYHVHTDTWDGNLLIKENRLVGMVDFAAILYGDPLMNHDFHDFSQEPREEFLEGYGKKDLSDKEKIRITVYKIWQRLGMIVERGYRQYEDKNQYFWVLDEFTKEIHRLKAMIEDLK